MRRKPKRTHLLDNLARHMRDRRRTLGLTQEQLAEKSGLSANYIARLEIADKTPSFATLVLLSEALEVEASELLACEKERTWSDSAEEIMRIMESLDDPDSRFILSQVRSLVTHLRLRGGPPV